MTTEGEQLIVLDFWASPYGKKLRIALAEKGIKHEYKEESLRNKSPLLLKANPVYKKLPVLIHNGKLINESLLALQYIEEVWNDKAPLLPSDPYLKAQARFWAEFITKKIYDHGKKLCMCEGEEKEAAKEEFIESLKYLENELGDKPYFQGETFGYVDVVLAPLHSWIYAYESCANFSMENQCPKLTSWLKRCLQRETVSSSLPDQKSIYEFILKLRKKLLTGN